MGGALKARGIMYRVIGYGGTRAFRVLWMLEELGLPYEHERLMPFTGAAGARRPGGRLPALAMAEGGMLIDSTAILTFLADRHNALTFPPGSVERARQNADLPGYGMSGRAADALDADATWPWRSGLRQWPGLAAPAHHRGDACLGDMLGKGPWIMGDVFTIADIVLGHCLHWPSVMNSRCGTRGCAFIWTG